MLKSRSRQLNALEEKEKSKKLQSFAIRIKMNANGQRRRLRGKLLLEVNELKRRRARSDLEISMETSGWK